MGAPGDANPLVNMVTAHYHPDGFTNDITDSDTQSVNLFQPGLTVTKTGDDLPKTGDAVNYNIEVCNTSSNDTPNQLVAEGVSLCLNPCNLANGLLSAIMAT